MHWVTCFKVSGFLKKNICCFSGKNYCQLFKNCCLEICGQPLLKMQFLVKLQALGLMQLYKKEAPSRLFSRILVQISQRIVQKELFLENPLLWNVFSGCLSLFYYFLFLTRHLLAPSQHDNTEGICLTERFFNGTMLTLSRSNRYLKNSVGKIFSKQQLQKRLRITDFFTTMIISIEPVRME